MPGRSATDRASLLLRTIAGHRLRTGSLSSWPERPLDQDAWSALTAEVEAQRIWSLLADAVVDGSLPATPSQTEDVLARVDQAVLGCLHLDRELRDLWERFVDAGIVARVFKGVSSALLVHPEPWLRTYSDVDLLVPGDQFDAAAEIITAIGGRRHNPDPRRGFTAALGKSAGFTLEGGWEIDLHRSLQGGPFGASVRTDDLFTSASAIVLGGSEISALSRTNLFLAACYHAVLPHDARRILPLLDVAHLLESAALDTREVVEVARRWRGSAVVAEAVTRAAAVFALADDLPLRGWSATTRPPIAEQVWLRACLSERPRAALAVGALTATAYRSPRHGARYLGTQFLHDDRQPVSVRARRLGRRLVQAPPRSVPVALPAGAEDHPRLGFVGFHSDGTGRDPLSQSELVAAALGREGYPVRSTSTKRPAVQRLLDQGSSIVAWRGAVDAVLIDVFSGRSFVSAEVTSRLCRLVGVPYVLVLHGGNLPRFLEEHPRRVQAIARPAARLAAPSPYLADAFRARGDVVQVIPNVVRSPVEVPRTRTAVGPSLLWMRTFERTYQPDLAVRALALVLAELPAATMTMAGADRGELDATIALAQRLGVSGSIRFAGFVGGDEKARLFEEHDLFVNTTSIDNTPVSVLEAAASGLPVVATRVGGIGVLLQDGVTGLLVDDDAPEQIAAAVVRLCADDDLARALSGNGIELAAGYAWPRVLDGWERLLTGMGLPVRPRVPPDGVVAPLALGDLPRIAEIHLAAFDDSQLSLLGADAVERYYRWLLLGPHENAALGIWRDGQLVGFLFGGRYRRALQGFLHRNLVPLAVGVLRHPGELLGEPFRARVRRGATVFTGRHRVERADRPRPAPVSTGSFGVLAIAVDPAAQGSGAARELLGAATAEARRRGSDGMHLNVSVDNARAVAFYEREGWVRVPDLGGGWTGAMRRALDDDHDDGDRDDDRPAAR